ncbi:MAG: CspA family cold shock protein [Planctomycetaceae bacterium]|jgi:CspA family cold shock protein
MNPTAKRLTITVISSIVAFFLISFAQQSLTSPVASIATFVIIFIGVGIGTFSGGSGRSQSRAPRGDSASSNSGSSSNSDSETGSVKWFNVKKGYGFITRDSGDDVFVHYRNIIGSGRRAIADGQRVSFVVIDGDKGLQADEVEAI